MIKMATKDKTFSKWMNAKVKKLDWTDIALVKIAVAAAVLFIAKLWAPILSLNWYWYLIICIIAAAKPIYTAYFKK